MDSETGCVDNLFEKSKDGVYRNHRNTRGSSIGLNPTIVKVVKDRVSKVKLFR